MSTTGQKVGAVAATAILGAGGALFGGPIGLAIGLVVGVGVDALILHAKAASAPMVMPPPGVIANAMIPGTPGLPPGANVTEGSYAVRLMLTAGVTSGNAQASVGPAQQHLKAFQASVGLPATGALDSATRAMLMLAVPSMAPNLPAKTILG